MDTKTLTVFLTLADTLHFGRTADACHMSPSTLTRAINKLESEVGAILFQRDNRSVTLTREGDIFRRYAIDSTALWSSLQEDLLDATEQLSGSLTLYGSVTASYSFMFDLLSRLRKLHPGIRITLQTGDPEQAINQVQSGDAQVSIGSRPTALPSAVSFKTMATTELVFIAQRDDSDTSSETSRIDWQHQPVILPQRGVARDRVTRWFRRMNISPEVSTQVAGNEAIVSMVSLGFGIGVVPEIVIENSLLKEQISVLDIEPALEPYDLGLFTLKRSLNNPLVRAFWGLSDH